LELGYKKVTVRYSTHAAGGLTENDFICAAKVSVLRG
jgi:4a-hydroxytetrahydrobiopterin dehydratase